MNEPVSTAHDDRPADRKREWRKRNGTSVIGGLVSNEPWMRDAACINVNPDLFFPERGESVSEAKAVCRGCDVRSDCLEYALRTNEQHGLWGGLSARERRKVAAQRNRAGCHTDDSA